MNIPDLLDLYSHMAWADAEVWKAVLGCESAHGDERIRKALFHLHGAQRSYLRVWQGGEMGAPLPLFEDLTSMLPWAMANCIDVCEYAAALTEEQIQAPIPEAWVKRVEQWMGPARGVMVLGDTVLQVPMHSQYHRGQVNARLRELGGTPPMVDYIAWVWLGRSAAAWPMVGE